MPRLLVLNPNTSAGVSALLATHVRAACGDRAIAVDVVTARLGAPYIACEASYAVAGHAALDAWAAAVQPPAAPPGPSRRARGRTTRGCAPSAPVSPPRTRSA